MITYQFSATDFTFTGLGTVGNGNGATVPQDPIIGSVTLDGSSIVGIDLAIAGHDYMPAEVGAILTPDVTIIGSLINGVDRLSSGTNDFQLFFGPQAFVFEYTTDVFDVGCQCTDLFSSITGTVTSVPEPATVLLLGAALIFALLFGRRA